MIPIGIYFYMFFKRICRVFHIDITSQKMKILIMILSFLFVFPARNVFHVWFVVVCHVFAFALICDLFIWLYQKRKEVPSLLMKIYQLGIIPILSTCLIIGYGYYNMQQIHRTHYTITTTKNLSKDYRVAFLSDLHFAETMDKEKLLKYCQIIENQNVDMIILGGDIVDELSTYEQMNTAFEVLGSMNCTYGVYYVYGNHDRALYSQNPSFTQKQLQDAITSNGIKILSENVFEFNDEFVLVGREDSSQDRKTTKELMKNSDSQSFSMLIDHKPISIQENDDTKIDLQLSGHTHGGQMFPVGLMIDFLGFGELSYGYKQYDYLQLIVSSGIGGWGYPIRTGSQSEYLIIDIVEK